LKWQMKSLQRKNLQVTLHVSVWVEMKTSALIFKSAVVTLHVSVWVEIRQEQLTTLSPRSHAPRERVSWNNYCKIIVAVFCSSRSTWACELKSAILFITILVSNVTLHVSVWVEITFIFQMRVNLASRSTWACELKSPRTASPRCAAGHAPRERVSWNNRNRIFRGGKSVTLHVSVWVEMIMKLSRIQM